MWQKWTFITVKLQKLLSRNVTNYRITPQWWRGASKFKLYKACEALSRIIFPPKFVNNNLEGYIWIKKMYAWIWSPQLNRTYDKHSVGWYGM